MKVRASFKHGGFGFYGSKRRSDGDEFTLESEDHFSEKWMVKLEEEEKPKKKRGRKPKAEVVESDSDNELRESEE